MTDATLKPALRCGTCGVKPTALEAQYTAELGGTHYRRLTHAAGVPGREQGGKFRSCGPWVAASAPADERAAAVQAWKAAR